MVVINCDLPKIYKMHRSCDQQKKYTSYLESIHSVKHALNITFKQFKACVKHVGQISRGKISLRNEMGHRVSCKLMCDTNAKITTDDHARE